MPSQYRPGEALADSVIGRHKHKQSRTRAAPTTRAKSDQPCRLAAWLADIRPELRPTGNGGQQPSAGWLRHQNCHLFDRTATPRAWHKYPGNDRHCVVLSSNTQKPFFLPQTLSRPHVRSRSELPRLHVREVFGLECGKD